MSTASQITPMLIGGERRLASDGATIPVTNPATGQQIGAIPAATADDVDAAVTAAGAAFPGWARLDPQDRARHVTALADLIELHADELARIDVKDNGSPIREMRGDTGVAAAQLRYFAGLVLQLRGHTIPTQFDRLNYTLRQPFGVVGRIVPFSHPLMFAAAKLAAPLVAGNTVVRRRTFTSTSPEGKVTSSGAGGGC